jgi:hypothetical protein
LKTSDFRGWTSFVFKSTPWPNPERLENPWKLQTFQNDITIMHDIHQGSLGSHTPVDETGIARKGWFFPGMLRKVTQNMDRAAKKAFRFYQGMHACLQDRMGGGRSWLIHESGAVQLCGEAGVDQKQAHLLTENPQGFPQPPLPLLPLQTGSEQPSACMKSFKHHFPFFLIFMQAETPFTQAYPPFPLPIIELQQALEILD